MQRMQFPELYCTPRIAPKSSWGTQFEILLQRALVIFCCRPGKRILFRSRILFGVSRHNGGPIVLWWSNGVQGGPQLSPMMPRGVILSDRYVFNCCCFSCLVLFVHPRHKGLFSEEMQGKNLKIKRMQGKNMKIKIMQCKNIKIKRMQGKKLKMELWIMQSKKLQHMHMQFI